jgi:hypothetical protein
MTLDVMDRRAVTRVNASHPEPSYFRDGPAGLLGIWERRVLGPPGTQILVAPGDFTVGIVRRLWALSSH